MTKRQKEKHVENIKEFLIKEGWTEDRWGNFKKTAREREFRLKFQKHSIRLEKMVESVGWIRIRSDYTKDIILTESYLKIKNAIIGEHVDKETGELRRYL